MNCPNCQRGITENSNFCYFCGARQPVTAPPASGAAVGRPLTLSATDKMIGGVCGGVAEHFGWETSVVRIVWLVLAIFTGVGFLAYLLAWIVVPSGATASHSASNSAQARRLMRSPTDRKIGGVCGGLGEYLKVDPTIIRLVWAIALLSGVGLVAYFVAWIVMPLAPVALRAPAAEPSAPAPQHS